MSVKAPGAFSDYLELTKPRLSLLSVITALIAYFAVRPLPADGWRILYVAIGTSLAAAGVAALNQWLEHETDARMKRTADRPIPAGRVPTGSAFVMGILFCIAACFLLVAKVNLPSALYTLATIISYLCLYTPAKRFSRWSTEIGAVAGAFPPLIGWAAAEGSVSALGWILFGVLFFWQIPHFMAIAWTHRQDYSGVSFPMLPVRDATGGWVAAWSLVNTIALIVLSLLPVYLKLATLWYGAAAALAGVWFLWRALAFMKAGSRDAMARKLFLCSIAYLPIVLLALVADRVINF